jgi:hypothetical protein
MRAAVSGGCGTCGGFDGLDGRGPVCQCGRLWAAGDVDWEQVRHFLVVRSGGRCEARTPWCFGLAGRIEHLPRSRVSIHHRRPRGMGGTGRADVHSLANLLLICGDGVQGCHGFLERFREVAEARGYLVAKEGRRSDPAEVPVTLPSGRRVFLDPLAPAYLDTAGGWAFGVPEWPAAA